MEVLVSVFGELFEKQSEKGVDVFAGGDRVRDRGAAVGKTGVDWLVQEDHACIGIPAVRVVHELDVLVHGRWAKLEEEAGKGRATRSAVEP